MTLTPDENPLSKVDDVTRLEIILNLVNTLLAKAMALGEHQTANHVHELRHTLYYGDFEYPAIWATLVGINAHLDDVAARSRNNE